jgi:hypothetical protein
MRLVSPRSLLLLLALAGPAPLLSAQTTISGVVQDSATGGPIASAEILIPAINRQTTADGQGRFEIRNIPPGQHLVQVRAIGYRAAGESVETSGLGTTRVVFELASEAVRLDSVVVTERPSTRGVGMGFEAFEERRRTRPGIFIDSVDMRRSESLDFRAVLRRSGVQLDRRSGVRVVGRGAIRNFRQSSTDCLVRVYLDGRRMEQDFDLRVVHPGMLRAVEVYPSVAQTPPQYDRLDQECGVMLIWTRR